MNIFYILDFIYYRVAEIYARRGLGPIGPEKFYTGAHPDHFVSFPVFGVTLFIPINIYKFIFWNNIDIESYLIGLLIVFALYSLLIIIIFDRRYHRMDIDLLRRKYKPSSLYRNVPGWAVISISIALFLVGMAFGLYTSIDL